MKYVYFPDGNTGYIAGENGTVLKITGSVTGFHDIFAASNQLSIYPNPANDILTIDHTNYKGIINGELIIFDSFGKKVFTQQIHQKKTSINITDLKPGLYFVHFKDDQGVVKGKVTVY